MNFQPTWITFTGIHLNLFNSSEVQYQLQAFDLHNSNSFCAFVLLDFSPSTTASCRFILSHQTNFFDFSQFEYILLLTYDSTKINCHLTFPSWLHDENRNELRCDVYIMSPAGICRREGVPLFWWRKGVRWGSVLKKHGKLQVSDYDLLEKDANSEIWMVVQYEGNSVARWLELVMESGQFLSRQLRCTLWP